MIPITYAETPEAVEEERRLLYVGVTRARERLSITWALARAPGGRGSRAAVPVPRRPARRRPRRRPPARGEPPRAARARPPAGSAASRCTARSARKLGRCEDCPSAYDEALFERLREWRAEQAQEASVPAYVVFTDATLIALAEARPAHRARAARDLRRRAHQARARTAPTCSPSAPSSGRRTPTS